MAATPNQTPNWQALATKLYGGNAPGIIQGLSKVDPNFDWSGPLQANFDFASQQDPGLGFTDPGRASPAGTVDTILENYSPTPGGQKFSGLYPNQIAASRAQDSSDAARIQREQASHGGGDFFSSILPLAIGAGALALGQPEFLGGFSGALGSSGLLSDAALASLSEEAALGLSGAGELATVPALEAGLPAFAGAAEGAATMIPTQVASADGGFQLAQFTPQFSTVPGTLSSSVNFANTAASTLAPGALDTTATLGSDAAAASAAAAEGITAPSVTPTSGTAATDPNATPTPTDPNSLPPADSGATLTPFLSNVPQGSVLSPQSSFASTLGSIGDAPCVGAPVASGFAGGAESSMLEDLGLSEEDIINAKLAGETKAGFTLPTMGDIGNFIKSNWKTLLPAGIAGASALLPQKQPANVGDINALASSLAGRAGANAGNIATLENPLLTGKLPDAQAAQLSSATDAIKAQIRAKYGSLGLSGSTMEQQELQGVDIQAQGLQANMEKQLFDEGLSLAGVTGQEQSQAASLYAQLAQLALSQDEQLRSGLTNVASALALGSAVGSKG